jgi:8-hydroxy-5-deazaflavin:NADPH oxidoreductase
MKVAIIGAGNVGRTLGGAWGRQGHDVSYGVPKPEDPKYAALNGHATTNERAAHAADVVVLCTPWQTTERAVAECGDLTGKVVIDCTNPLSADVSSLVVGHTSSGAEQVAGWAPGARICKAMNQIGAANMDRPTFAATPVMFVCGDDAEAKDVTSGLVSELGFEAVDAGALDVSRLLEPYGLLWIHLALRRGLGPRFGFGLLRPQT